MLSPANGQSGYPRAPIVEAVHLPDQPTNYTSLSISVPSGIELQAKVWGRAPPDHVDAASKASSCVLAVHGWLDNANSWDLIAPKLAECGAYVVCVDLPGHGHSEHRHQQGGYYLWDMVDDLLGIVDHLGWQTFTIIGHSTGGHIAATFAGVFPNRVRAIAMIESIGTSIQFTADEPVELAGFIQRRREFNRAPRRMRVYNSFEDAAAARTNGFTKVSIDAARLLCQRGLEPVDDASPPTSSSGERHQQGYRWRTDPKLTLWAFLHCPEVTIQALFRSITAPVLIVAGSQSEIFSLDAKRWSGRLSSFRVLRKATLIGNHHLHLEKETSGNVLNLLVDFLGWGSAADNSVEASTSALTARGVRLGTELGSAIVPLSSLAAIKTEGGQEPVKRKQSPLEDGPSSRSAAAALCSFAQNPRQSPVAPSRATGSQTPETNTQQPYIKQERADDSHTTVLVSRPREDQSAPVAASPHASSSASSVVGPYSPYTKSPKSALETLSAVADQVARSSMSPSVQNSPLLEAGSIVAAPSSALRAYETHATSSSSGSASSTPPRLVDTPLSMGEMTGRRVMIMCRGNECV
ncbi:Alpha/Beta hydrolase protein [Chytridium lagenaria]|nr:Alpha/Beta hydrolase protein [Chytridium lagenaria]